MLNMHMLLPSPVLAALASGRRPCSPHDLRGPAPLPAHRTCPTALTPLSVRAARIQCSCDWSKAWGQQARCSMHHNTEHGTVNGPHYPTTKCACKHDPRHGQHSGRRATAGPPSYTRAHPHLRRRWPPPRAARETARPRCSWPPGCAACPAGGNRSTRGGRTGTWTFSSVARTRRRSKQKAAC